nr:AAA domain-containing protein [uncultured Thiocystis sp.]
MSTTQARGIQSLRQQGILERIDTMLGELDELKTAFDGYAPLQRSDAALIAADGPLSTLEEQIRPILGICQRQLIDTTASVAEVERTVNQLGEIQSYQQALNESAFDPQWFDHQIDLLADPDQLDEATLTAAEHTAEFAQALEERVKLRILSAGIRRQPNRELFTALRQFAEQMETAWQRHLDRRAQFVDLTELDLDAWQIGTGHTLDGLIDRNRNALQQPDWLSNWLDYVRVRHQVKSIGFTRLTTAIERGILPADEIDAGYRLAVFDVLAREILREVPALATFSGNAQRALQQQFSQYDETLKRLQRERIAWRIAQNPIPPGSTGARASDYTELALLQRECAKKTKHIPLRQLVHRAGNALVALKPCFMMGPMSVAQYLAPGQIDFDLIVMDEASQMKPQDALGAIARGRQLVVVGDPKQLPPTSFFDRVIDDEEEEATAIEESENILETAIPLFHHRRLRWHYRSQHESLIAFSNHAFYKGVAGDLSLATQRFRGLWRKTHPGRARAVRESAQYRGGAHDRSRGAAPSFPPTGRIAGRRRHERRSARPDRTCRGSDRQGRSTVPRCHGPESSEPGTAVHQKPGECAGRRTGCDLYLLHLRAGGEERQGLSAFWTDQLRRRLATAQCPLHPLQEADAYLQFHGIGGHPAFGAIQTRREGVQGLSCLCRNRPSSPGNRSS